MITRLDKCLVCQSSGGRRVRGRTDGEWNESQLHLINLPFKYAYRQEFLSDDASSVPPFECNKLCECFETADMCLEILKCIRCILM